MNVGSDPNGQGNKLVAASVAWGMPNGIVAVSAYFKDSVGMDEQNQDMLYQLVCYLGQLNDMGRPWIVGGDWNMESTTFDGQAWLEQLRAVF